MFSHSECKTPLQYRTGTEANLVLDNEELEKVDKFPYLWGNNISRNHTPDEVPLSIRKVQLALTKLRNVWLGRFIRLSITDPVSVPGAVSVLPY